MSIVPPPLAKKKPHSLSIHGDTRIDPYFWLKERESKEVIDYIEDENHYYKQATAHTEDLQEELFQEMKSRIKEDDSSVPYKFQGYWYSSRYEKGGDYPIFTRRKGNIDAEEEVILDVNLEAKPYEYYDAKALVVSPDNKFLVYGEDTVGRREYTLRIKNLETNEVLQEKIENTTGAATWANDSATLFYTKKDPETLRSYLVKRHTLGTPEDNDVIVFEETDDTFDVFVYKTKSQQYICISSSATLTSEYRFINANTPLSDFKIFQERIRGVEYDLAHYKDQFYILTNLDNAYNFKIMTCHIDNTTKTYWKPLLEHREEVLVEDIDVFNDYLVISERSNGLSHLRIKTWDGSQDYYLPFDNETYSVYAGINLDFDTDWLRYGYTSLTTPSSVIEFNMKTQAFNILKEQEVLDDNFDKNNYISERLWATADDGVKIPISIIYHKDFKKDGTAPLLQYAYGSYGYTIDPYFSSSRLSLLDRGFVYAIAHIRGSEYLGRKWYESGKLLEKKNTFTDFIACSKYLIEEKYTSSDSLYAMGGSAGGLLMGAVINIAPQLYNGVVTQVPFVDVVTTMLDDTIPLTTGEYDEWGNPNDKTYYDYMKSYSPYDNVIAQHYPNMLVTTGFHDSQVQYWEPAKWVAKLRNLKLDNNLLYLHTNMDAGHGGASGRFEALREQAEEFTFLIDLQNQSK